METRLSVSLMYALSTLAGTNVSLPLYAHCLTRNDMAGTDGLTYAGVGWAIWRNKSFLPDEILFTVNYLGSPQVSFTLNFSKSGVHVIGQYYQLLRLGKAGYRSIVSNFIYGLSLHTIMKLTMTVMLDEQPDEHERLACWRD